VNEKFLRIYLQDHLAGSTAGLELARRTRGANEGTEYGTPLAKIADEIEADRRQLEGIIDDLGFGGDRLKNAAAWGLEKAGRLKLNGQLTGYSPLSRLVEIEGLLALVRGARSMWLALARLDDRRLRGLDLLERAERAERHMAELERIELKFVPEAIGTAGEGARKAVEP
jgi:hypothetical protein